MVLKRDGNEGCKAISSALDENFFCLKIVENNFKFEKIGWWIMIWNKTWKKMESLLNAQKSKSRRDFFSEINSS